MFHLFDFVKMKIIDYFFYLTYCFLKNKVERSSENAKWSALIHSSLYLCLSIDTTIYLFGLIINNTAIKYYTSLGVFGLILLCLISMTLLYLRFYTGYAFDKIVTEYNQMGEKRKKYIKIIIYVLMIFVPVFWFVIGRLYLSLGNVSDVLISK